jgi:3-hydroxypropanoate dehydrogenase
MTEKIDESALDQLFRDARTYNSWTGEPVGEDLVRQLWDLVKMGPTSANCSPARLVFVMSDAAKEKLKPCLMDGNIDKTMSAAATVIIGQDMAFYEKLPELFPHTDAKSWFTGNDDLIRATAFRNSTLQGAYLIMAARALGLDCGPMSGFDQDKVDQAFFPGTKVTANFLCNIGYGTSDDLFPRSPRLSFDDACRIV